MKYGIEYIKSAIQRGLIKTLMADLKRVYGAVDEDTALYELEGFDEKWGTKYPKIAQSWRDNCPKLATYFKYPQEVRTLIYTTNAIENFNRPLRKVTKSKSVFPTEDSFLKMLYLAMVDITKKWTGKRRDWGMIHSQLEVFSLTVCLDSTTRPPRQGQARQDAWLRPPLTRRPFCAEL